MSKIGPNTKDHIKTQSLISRNLTYFRILDSLETENIGLTLTLISIDHAPDMIGKEKLFTSK